MTKKKMINTFIKEIYTKPPKKHYETNKTFYNHIDETWSIGLADFSDYKTSNGKIYRYIFIIIDFFSKYTWAKTIKNKNSQTKTNVFSNILSSSKRSPLKTKSDREAEV